MSWISALWQQITGKAECPQPWDEDPEIVAERARQHALGVSDYVTQLETERELWRQRQIRKRRIPDG